MATHLRENLGLEAVADVLDATTAALESGPQTKVLATNWALLTARTDAPAGERRKLDRDGRRARVQLAVRDAEWDATVAAGNKVAQDLG